GSLKQLEKGIRKVEEERDVAQAALLSAKSDAERLSRESANAYAAATALKQEIAKLSAQCQQSEQRRIELQSHLADKTQSATRELLDQQRMALELERKNSVLARLEAELAAARS